MAKSGNYQIPFDKDGNPQTYPETWWVGEYPNHKATGPEWRDNVDFYKVMTYDGFGRGRSSALLYFKDDAGIRYPMFMKDFDECAKHLVEGKVAGLWRFVKRGQNYGLTQVKAEPVVETETTVAADAYWWIADLLKTESGWSVQEHVQWMHELAEKAFASLGSMGADRDKSHSQRKLWEALRACLAGECPNGRFEE